MPRSKKSKRRPGRQEYIPDVPRNAAPNGAKLRAELKNSSTEFRSNRVPPQAVLDKIAERKITGGYKIVKRNLCKVCFQYRSANGSCECRSRSKDGKIRKLTKPHPISPYANL